MLSPAERSRAASIGGKAVIGKYGRHTIAARARAGFIKRFEEAADPEYALKAYFTSLAHKSAKARAARKAQKDGAK